MFELESTTTLDTEARLDEILRLYERGLYLQALRCGESFGDLTAWPGVRGKLLAARIAGQLGASRRAEWLFRRAYRAVPESGEARYFYAYGRLRRRGPYNTRRWMLAQPPMGEDETLDVRTSWLALRGQVAGALRDFDEAESWLNQARELQPDSAWVLVCCSSVLEAEDRYEEAFALIESALQLRPNFRPAVQAAGHLLVLLGRGDEALERLIEWEAQLESASVAAQLYSLYSERKCYAEANHVLKRVEELSPLAEKLYRQWIAAERAEIAYHLGDVEAAIRFAEQSDSEYQKAIAERLKEPDQSGRKSVLLPVTFVRQHQMTCAPATLSALSRYWSKPADHLQVADEICYSGTSWYSERKWARENGWKTREFSVTEESTIALLDRGIPFTFTTVEPTDSHLQAIIGYDSRRGTIQIRDPYWPNVGEGLMTKVLTRYRAHGPRGMAMVPVEQREKLDGLDLPDAELWDLLHQFDGALEQHQRDTAVGFLAKMQAIDAKHRITLEACRRLAGYDGNEAEQLSVVEALLEQFPDEQRLQLERLSLMRHQTKRAERLATYERMCKSKDSHPIFWQQYAQEMREDARRHDEAARLLHRAIRRWPTNASNYYILASLYWQQRKFDEAIYLYRISVCLDDKDEQFADSYFSAARMRNRAPEAIALLRARFARYCYKSALPARTLASAYMRLDRAEEALDIVDQALTLRPDDGELLLFAAQTWLDASLENVPQAKGMIERAKDKVPKLQFARAAARVAAYEGRLGDSLALWEQVLELQPMLMEAHARVAQLKAETSSNAAALEHLAAAAERFPHYYPLHELWITWLREEPFAVREPVIRRFLEVNHDNAWAHREYSQWLADEKRLAEAWAEAEIAGKLEPNNVSYHHLRGDLYRAEDKLPEAREEFKRAIELSVDSDYAVSTLVALCTTTEERRAALRFIKEQLVAQVIVGDGLLTFRDLASDTLEAEELLAILQEACNARPDLWHAWSALAQQLWQMDRLDEAWNVIEQATERYPLMPRLWLDRAEICHSRLDRAGEKESLEAALRINPGWSVANRALAEYHAREGNFDECRRLLERAVAWSPLDVLSHVALGEALWRAGEKEKALEQARKAVQLEPGYDRAWNALEFWSEQLGKPELAIQVARELTERRSGEARSWLILARMLDQPEQAEERLAALDRSIALSPRAIDAYDQRAKTLASVERYTEAVAACRPAVFGEHPPQQLQARAIWVDWVGGRRVEAIAAMKELLQREPLFYGGWYWLAEWSREAEDKETYLQAAEHVAQLNPQSEVSWGFLGDARLMNGYETLAAEAFERAFELDPQYEFAGNMVFDKQFAAGDLIAAAETYRRLRLHSSTSFVLARGVQLAAKRGDQREALRLLREICVQPYESSWPLHAATEAIAQLGRDAARAARDVLGEMAGTVEADRFVGQHWVDASLAVGDATIGTKVESLRGTTDAADQAVQALLIGWAQLNLVDSVVRFIFSNRPWLREKFSLWASAGHAFTLVRRWKLGAEWMSNWRQQPEARPWALVNAAECLRSLNRMDEAIDCSRYALSLPPDHGSRLHELLLVADAAVAGDMAYVEAHLPAVTNPDDLDPDYQLVIALVRAISLVATSPQSARGGVFWSAARQMNDACTSYAIHLPYEPWRQKLVHAARWRLAVLAERWWARAWYYGKRVLEIKLS